MDRRKIAEAIDPQAFDGTLARMIPSGVEDAQEAALTIADRILALLETEESDTERDQRRRFAAELIRVSTAG
ncbi:MAG: hypothetical protein AAF220_14300, partial [Pseudomonadota bacterium]